ncbi:MAG: transcriptional repressor [Bacilli bacterium]|nr:transcriptional repressor [Bacilli bacterium]
MTYNTKQKDKILDIIMKKEHEFTIKDIHTEIPEVGLTTIYRLIDKLVENNSINKYIGKDNITYYQYLEKCDEDNHFYLKCEKCGDIIHIDCDCISELKNHILNNHKFKLNKDHIIINGICDKCGD